ncbi:MAG: hypothetical protein JWR05_1936 [Mucilaginibacter sp.]|nr:hypothetical protein [Mucilaginibacter sp.]
MKVLKSKSFRDPDDITEFVNKNSINREDMFAITRSENWYTVFYYAEE